MSHVFYLGSIKVAVSERNCRRTHSRNDSENEITCWTLLPQCKTLFCLFLSPPLTAPIFSQKPKIFQRNHDSNSTESAASSQRKRVRDDKERKLVASVKSLVYPFSLVLWRDLYLVRISAKDGVGGVYFVIAIILHNVLLTQEHQQMQTSKRAKSERGRGHEEYGVLSLRSRKEARKKPRAGALGLGWG